MPLFSILIPCYNIENDLPNAIESVLAQTCSNYEIILVNDGSTDNTFQVMKSYEHYERIKVVDNSPNKGLAATRNAGFKYLTGEYVLFLDGDDTYSPDLLLDIEQFLQRHPNLDIVSFGSGRFCDGKLISDFVHPEHHECVFNGHDFMKLHLKRKLKQHICSFAMKLSLLRKHELWFDEETPVGEDQEFQIKANFHCREIGYLGKMYFKYNVRDTSLMGEPFNRKRLTTLNVFERVYSYLRQRKADKAIIKNLINYSSIEYLSVLNKCIKQGAYEFIDDIRKTDRVVHLNGALGFDKFSLISLVLKTAYRISPSLFIAILKTKNLNRNASR
ncbi:glycosyltransferase family 2 protein [Pedobacter sp. SAFR-022]|uniref:glycosyltransferase family 2 protein n=1 Tax=Pedobacter sp. SAFR-022 TaxID=3436861 RepID=UPI003F7EC8AB